MKMCESGVDMPLTLTKVTETHSGYQVTGDFECSCLNPYNCLDNPHELWDSAYVGMLDLIPKGALGKRGKFVIRVEFYENPMDYDECAPPHRESFIYTGLKDEDPDADKCCVVQSRTSCPSSHGCPSLPSTSCALRW